MAKNTGNKRISVKWVRDKAKAAYDKKDCCYICGTDKDLELHHTHSVTLLLNNWAEKKSYDISTDDGILAVRDEFIREHYEEIYTLVYTLCNKDHIKLHSVYGKAPSLASASKQGSWIEVQKTKHLNKGVIVKNTISTFGSFY